MTQDYADPPAPENNIVTSEIARAQQHLLDWYWEEFERGGRRHKNAVRFLRDLGWTIAPDVLERYLNPEASPYG